MLEGFKKSWRDLAKDCPGHRFQNRHRRQDKRSNSGAARVLKLGGGIALTVAGVMFLLIPGPGSVLIVIGGALLAEESLTVARLIDRVEVRVRKWIDAARSRWAARRSRYR